MMKIRLIDKAIEVTGSGIFQAVISQAGIHTYVESGGRVVRRLRDEKLVEESASLYDGKPLLDGHPEALKGVYGRQETIGVVLDSKGENGRVLSRLAMTDSSILSERIALSPGVTATIEQVPGTWKGQPYDEKIVAIEPDHLAIVDRARQGDEVKVLLDRGDDVSIEIDPVSEEKTDLKDLDSLHELILILTDRIASMQGTIDSLYERLWTTETMDGSTEGEPSFDELPTETIAAYGAVANQLGVEVAALFDGSQAEALIKERSGTATAEHLKDPHLRLLALQLIATEVTKRKPKGFAPPPSKDKKHSGGLVFS
jgi:hypothetical protein